MQVSYKFITLADCKYLDGKQLSEVSEVSDSVGVKNIY